MEGYIDGGIYREIEMEIQIDGESDVKWGQVYWMVEPEYKGWHSYASLSVWAQEQLWGRGAKNQHCSECPVIHFG